jgi:hypothetical protein
VDIIVVLCLGSALAGFVQGFAGFGFGLASLAVWSWVVQPSMAVPLVVYGSLIGQLLAVSALRNSFNWPRLKPFLFGGIAGIPVGMYLLTLMNPLFFKFGVGLLLAAYCTTLLSLKHIPRIHHGGRVADGVVGIMGGIMSGFGGLPGPVPTLWCALRGWPKDQQRGVFQAFNLCMHAVTLTGLYLHGLITPEILKLFIYVTPALLIPTLIGLRLYHRVSDGTFRICLLVMLALSGVAMLVSTTPKVLHALQLL